MKQMDFSSPNLQENFNEKTFLTKWASVALALGLAVITSCGKESDNKPEASKAPPSQPDKKAEAQKTEPSPAVPEVKAPADAGICKNLGNAGNWTGTWLGSDASLSLQGRNWKLRALRRVMSMTFEASQPTDREGACVFPLRAVTSERAKEGAVMDFARYLKMQVKASENLRWSARGLDAYSELVVKPTDAGIELSLKRSTPVSITFTDEKMAEVQSTPELESLKTAMIEELLKVDKSIDGSLWTPQASAPASGGAQRGALGGAQAGSVACAAQCLANQTKCIERCGKDNLGCVSQCAADNIKCTEDCPK